MQGWSLIFNTSTSVVSSQYSLLTTQTQVCLTIGRQEKINYPFNKNSENTTRCVLISKSTCVFTLTRFHLSVWGNIKTTRFKWRLRRSLSSRWRSSWATWLDRGRWRTAGRFLRWTSRSPAPGDARLSCGRAPLWACTTSESRPPPSGSRGWRRKMTPSVMRKINRNSMLYKLLRNKFTSTSHSFPTSLKM